MVDPIYTINYSLMKEKIYFYGDLKILSELNQIALDLCKSGKSLYEAESYVKTYIIGKYGVNYYEKYGEAIHVIVEEVYNDKMRCEQPMLVDLRGDSSVMY